MSQVGSRYAPADKSSPPPNPYPTTCAKRSPKSADNLNTRMSQLGTLLYSRTVTATSDPTIVATSSVFSSGSFPFTGYGGPTTGIPIYLSYSPSGTGTMYFDT